MHVVVVNQSTHLKCQYDSFDHSTEVKSGVVLGQVIVFTLFLFRSLVWFLQCVWDHCHARNPNFCQASSFHSVFGDRNFHGAIYKCHLPHTLCTHTAPYAHFPTSMFHSFTAQGSTQFCYILCNMAYRQLNIYKFSVIFRQTTWKSSEVLLLETCRN